MTRDSDAKINHRHHHRLNSTTVVPPPPPVRSCQPTLALLFPTCRTPQLPASPVPWPRHKQWWPLPPRASLATPVCQNLILRFLRRLGLGHRQGLCFSLSQG